MPKPETRQSRDKELSNARKNGTSQAGKHIALECAGMHIAVITTHEQGEGTQHDERRKKIYRFGARGDDSD